ncbi:hypothetical protein, partial [Desulfovibrio sp.]|uniref:hypothetical protein n=1 Tax=Desulfovibrio sp. TaxID=885 RepID=UPI003FEF11DA
NISTSVIKQAIPVFYYVFVAQFIDIKDDIFIISFLFHSTEFVPRAKKHASAPPKKRPAACAFPVLTLWRKSLLFRHTVLDHSTLHFFQESPAHILCAGLLSRVPAEGRDGKNRPDADRAGGTPVFCRSPRSRTGPAPCS